MPEKVEDIYTIDHNIESMSVGLDDTRKYHFWDP